MIFHFKCGPLVEIKLNGLGHAPSGHKQAGHGQGSKAESCRGIETSQKTRRIPLVGCKLCWAFF